jgi:LysM repeat protein
MKRLLIDLSARRLTYYDEHGIANSYPIAIGKPSTPTPVGQYQVINKIIHPGGGLGSRWMELNIPTDGGPYGIHGTNNPSSIGLAVSNGCIRMYNHDIEAIFSHIPLYTPVEIVASQWPGNLYNPAQGRKIYFVKPGDTIWQIALNYGITPDALLIANPTVNPNLLYPGQQLVIPE